ncbi:hypothetical protein [Paenibacillus sp. NEAU-GSW1]|uniref:hypothetical protein n=1 Tax=Paenibacillus sp. NEAU-GSW1 TaxID=2682486 RepID=UPI0012E1E4A1|nr:hypothetical protein [Paenibacillus sp. NEAU-GSW1]MUT67013.1 hypothetical protein [Paenibacillus sp. NEAU-GSW1]
MITIVVVAVSLIVAGYEFRLLIQSKSMRDIIVGFSFLAVALALVVLNLLNVDIPSPLSAVTNLFKPVHQIFVQLLS